MIVPAPSNVMCPAPVLVGNKDSKNGVFAASPIKDMLNNKLRSSNLSPYVKLIAGMCGGVAEACALQPLDVAKTRLQLDKAGKYNNMVHCLKTIAKEEGYPALYKGLTPFVTHLTFKYALRFGLFEQIKMLMGADEKGNASKAVNFSAGLAVGCIEATLIVTPFEVIKTRLQKQVNVPGQVVKYKGPIDVVVKVIKEEGIRRMWSGNMPTVIRQGSNQAFNFMTMAILNQALWGKTQGDGKTLAAWQTLLNGLLAGAVGPCLNCPVDVIKTRMMAQDYSDPNNIKYQNWHQAARIIAQEEGVAALWKGLIPRLTRLAPGQAITWTVVMRVSSFFEDKQKELREEERFQESKA